MLIFVAVGITILGTIHLYLWLRLVRGTMAKGPRRRAAGFAILGAAALAVATLLAGEALPRPYQAWVAGAGYGWLGIMFLLLVGLLALELPVLAARWVLARRSRDRRSRVPALVPAGPEPTRPEPEPDPGRRLLLRRAAAITAGVAAVSVGGYGVSRAFREPTVKRLAVPLARLDPRADGLRVAVIADIHVGPLYGAGQVERVVALVNGLDPDIVTVVGDMVSSEVDKVRESAAPLRGLRSRYGAYFVTGNHEYYTGHEEWIEAADELGLRVLRNERVEIAHRGGAVDLAGVNDREGSRYDDPPDYAAALDDRDPALPVLLMAHQPVQVHEAARYGVDLQLSGLAEVDGTLVYVTNGAGFWGPPMRVGADPDVTLVELRSETLLELRSE